MQTQSRTARSVPLGRRAARECRTHFLAVHTIILHLFSCCIVLNVIRLSESLQDLLYGQGITPGSIGSVTKRVLSSRASKAYGSASCHGIDCELCKSASPLGGQCHLSFPRVWH